MVFRHFNIRLSGALLALLFVFYTVSSGFFFHVHEDEHGEWVLHSHPFSEEANHQHNSADYCTIDRLASFDSSTPLSWMHEIQWHAINTHIVAVYDFQGLSADFFNFLFCRPPPVIA